MRTAKKGIPKEVENWRGPRPNATDGETSGRIAFGVAALLVDALLVFCAARLLRQMRRARANREPSLRPVDPAG